MQTQQTNKERHQLQQAIQLSLREHPEWWKWLQPDVQINGVAWINIWITFKDHHLNSYAEDDLQRGIATVTNLLHINYARALPCPLSFVIEYVDTRDLLALLLSCREWARHAESFTKKCRTMAHLLHWLERCYLEETNERLVESLGPHMLIAGSLKQASAKRARVTEIVEIC